MPSNQEVRRLLNLYRHQALREIWQTDESTKDALIEHLVTTVPFDQIVDFSFLYHPTTKHHLHLFEFTEISLDDLHGDPLGLPTLHGTQANAHERSWFYLLPLTFRVYYRDPLETEDLHFLWPITVTCQRAQLAIRFTIMAKDMRSHVATPRRIIRVDRDFDEATIQAVLLGNLMLTDVEPLDLNKGIKTLWDAGTVDAPLVQFKKPRATTRQVMDADYLVRRDDPTLYADLLDKPIFRAVFKWLGESDIGLDHFTVGASQGIITFPTFSDLDKGASHVVREILEAN